MLGDTGTGARDGALVVAGKNVARPTTGPLADGRLTADELLAVQLATARPSSAAEPGRYAYEGFGWADATAEQHAVDVLKGRRPLPARLVDTAAHGAALTGRSALTTAKGCTAPPP